LRQCTNGEQTVAAQSVQRSFGCSVNTDEYLKLHRIGVSDQKAAKILNTTRYRVRKLRRGLGLPLNFPAPRPINRKAFWRVYARGLSDGNVKSTVAKWLQRVCKKSVAKDVIARGIILFPVTMLLFLLFYDYMSPIIFIAGIILSVSLVISGMILDWYSS